MKKLFLLFIPLLLLVSCMSFETTSPELLAEPATYVYDFPEITKEDLFTKSKVWIAETFVSAEAVLTFEDLESGLLKGNGIGNVRQPGDPFNRGFKYSISIEVKDNKSRLKFGNVSAHRNGDVAGVDMKYKLYYDLMKEKFDVLAESYEKSIITVSDW